MKKLKLIICAMFLIAIASQGQVSVNVNLGTPPVWAPANRVETQYYYLPDIDAYYDVPSARFIYLKNGGWIRSAALPYQYRNYNLRGGNVVYLTDYRGKSPYTYYKNHKIKYGKKIKYKEVSLKKEDNYEEKHDRSNNDDYKNKDKGHGKGHKK